MSPHVTNYKRSIYTCLDFLGDLGGLYDALLFVGQLAVTLYTIVVGNEMENYILKTLFTRKSQLNQDPKNDFKKSVKNSISPVKPFSKESMFFMYCKNDKEKLM